MKKHVASLIAIGFTLSGTAFAGSETTNYLTAEPDPAPGAFALERRPISNPTLFDSALPQTRIHAIYMHHQFPSFVNGIGGPIPFGGDLNLYAVQLEYAFSERLSFVATKDGYIDFNPGAGSPFTPATGFANLAGGLKYAFQYDPVNQFVASGTAVVEVPTGNRDVFQGDGDGSVNLSVSALKLHDLWQLAGTVGAQIPFDSDFSTQAFASVHVSYELSRWFIPLLELNYFTVLDDGDGGARFNQVGGAVPAVATFEGADLINWGSANGSDYATVAVGFRSRLTDRVDVGVAYEFPLTDEEDNITDDRITVDMNIDF